MVELLTGFISFFRTKDQALVCFCSSVVYNVKFNFIWRVAIVAVDANDFHLVFIDKTAL